MFNHTLAACALLYCVAHASAYAAPQQDATLPAHQHQSHAMANQPASAPTNPTIAAQASAYTDMWASYRKFTDPPLANWRQSNALVEQIGGWMAIAQEAHAGMSSEADAAKDKK